ERSADARHFRRKPEQSEKTAVRRDKLQVAVHHGDALVDQIEAGLEQREATPLFQQVYQRRCGGYYRVHGRHLMNMAQKAPGKPTVAALKERHVKAVTIGYNCGKVAQESCRMVRWTQRSCPAGAGCRGGKPGGHARSVSRSRAAAVVCSSANQG